MADTILQCVTKEWAKFLLDKGVQVALGANPEIEVERIRNKLEYKYGADIHWRISAKSRVASLKLKSAPAHLSWRFDAR